ncbi:hypothetical protein C2E23DRAFT_729617, partial [Lenzites betulinus]
MREQQDLSDASNPTPHIANSFFDPVVSDVDIEEHIALWNLNREQARAFRIIANHSLERDTDALRMYLGGFGGTGKSRVIQALTSYFKAKKQSRRLRLASYTGIAAKHISGVTLHAALALDKRRSGK